MFYCTTCCNIMLELCPIITTLSILLQHLIKFMLTLFVFRNDNLKALRESLNSEDQKTFFMDMKKIIWDDYMLNYILATRKYCLKDDPSTLPKARRVFAYLYVMDIFLKIAFVLFFSWIIYSWIIPYKFTVGSFRDSNLDSTLLQ